MITGRSSAHRPARLVFRTLLILLVLAAVALLGLHSLVRRRSAALQAGSSFSFSYQVTSTTAEPSLAYSTLASLDALTGTITGQSSGSDLHLVWYGAGSGQDESFTDIYIKDGEVLLNIRRLYDTYINRLIAQYPLISPLVPGWGLGDYISQTKLARLLGQESALAEMGHFSVSTFSLQDMQRATPENALNGYFYFTPKQTYGDASVTIGFPLCSIWGESFDCHVLVDSPSQGLQIELIGIALPGSHDIELPTSLMQNKDIAALADIAQAIRAIAAFIREMAA